MRGLCALPLRGVVVGNAETDPLPMDSTAAAEEPSAKVRRRLHVPTPVILTLARTHQRRYPRQRRHSFGDSSVARPDHHRVGRDQLPAERDEEGHRRARREIQMEHGCRRV
jgi:hypothetical protein